MRASVSIREALPDDAAELAVFGAKCFTATFGNLYPVSDLQKFLEAGYTIEVFLEWISDSSRFCIFIAEIEGSIVGYILVGPCSLPHHDITPLNGEIKRCYVDASVFGKGVSDKLMVNAIAWVRSKYPHVIYLGVYSENPRAIKFYKRFGFEHVGDYFYEVGACRDLEFILREATVDVYVGGDGGSWSCTDSVLYRIPTEIFDYNMLIGRLNTKEDLDYLISELQAGCSLSAVDNSAMTDIWVAHSGVWSGYPCLKFSLPADIFHHLQTGNAEHTIGKLTSQEDLFGLIVKSRQEMLEGSAPCARESVSIANYSTIEVKDCRHSCTISSVKIGCCACSDLRPLSPNGKYPMYRDGVGWVNEAERSSGYCPHCRPVIL